QSVELALGRGDRGEGGVRARADLSEPGGQARDAIAVAHPHGELFARLVAREHARALADHDASGAVLPLAARLHLAAELLGHELLAVADAEHGDAELEEAGVALRRRRIVDAVGAAAQHDGAWGERPDLGERKRAGMDLAVDVAFADASRDELGVLRTAVEDQDLLAGCHEERGS